MVPLWKLMSPQRPLMAVWARMREPCPADAGVVDRDTATEVIWPSQPIFPCVYGGPPGATGPQGLCNRSVRLVPTVWTCVLTAQDGKPNNPSRTPTLNLTTIWIPPLQPPLQIHTHLNPQLNLAKNRWLLRRTHSVNGLEKDVEVGRCGKRHHIRFNTEKGLTKAFQEQGSDLPFPNRNRSRVNKYRTKPRYQPISLPGTQSWYPGWSTEDS